MNVIEIKKVDADLKDQIAEIHAKSWSNSYRGIFSDHYLDHEVLNERKSYWEQKFLQNNILMEIWAAFDSSKVIGFVCAFTEPNGTVFVDNLHVLSDYQGHGYGFDLLKKVSKNKKNMYLWVFENNISARKFYEKTGGESVERKTQTLEDLSEAIVHKYYWDDLNNFS
jgi:ribosomal protein S18 acetylase RimI-like enzyme